MAMIDQNLRDQINKRFTLNWLIQGAAQHAGMTFHHLVRDELNALDPILLRLYDQYALINLLQYWNLDAVVLFGWPPRFWKRAVSKRSHPFFSHPLLSKFGGMLAADGRQRAVERASDKGVTRKPILFSIQVASLVARLRMVEMPHRLRLVELAKKCTSEIWRIPINRLDGDLCKPAPFGTPIRIRNFKAALFRGSVVGLGGVVQQGDSLQVVGKGTNWQLLTKELVKGTAELICLHGLCDLSDDIYSKVMDAADRIEYEPWMLQTGGELWRRFLAVIPEGQPVAEILMHMSRLPPNSLQSLVQAVIERPDWAKELLANLQIAESSTIND